MTSRASELFAKTKILTTDEVVSRFSKNIDLNTFTQWREPLCQRFEEGFTEKLLALGYNISYKPNPIGDTDIVISWAP